MKRSILVHITLLFCTASIAAHYRGLSVVNDQIAWMSGSSGTVLRTINGGLNWDTLNPAGFENRDFRDIHAWNRNMAITMSAGDSAVLLLTRNGGKTWKTLAEDNSSGVFWDAMDLSHHACILVGDGRTPDLRFAKNLKTFQKLKATYYASQQILWDFDTLTRGKTASLFAASGTSVQWTDYPDFAYIPVYGEYCLFVKASLSKRKKFPDPSVREKWSQTITGFSVLPFKIRKAGGAYSFALQGSFGVAVGGSYLEPGDRDSIACYTTDGGNIWLPCETMPGGYRSCVCKLLHREIWYCTGTNGTDISADSGKNWKSTGIQGYNVCASSENYIWFAGNKGTWHRELIAEMIK